MLLEAVLRIGHSYRSIENGDGYLIFGTNKLCTQLSAKFNSSVVSCECNYGTSITQIIEALYSQMVDLTEIDSEDEDDFEEPDF